MARIRTIKPEFWQDEKLAPMDAVTRLVFVGLISQADDAGRLVDSVRMLDGLLFPFTDESCAGPLDSLHGAGVIERGKTASGQPVIQVVNWHHQRIDKPNLLGCLPEIAKPAEPAGNGVVAPFVETSGNDPGNVAEASTPLSVSVSVPVSVSTTADSAGERAHEAVDPVAEMISEFEAYAERAEPDPVKRKSFLAKARLVAKGEDRPIWEDPEGTPAPMEERPRLLRLALARLEAGESDTVRGAIKLTVAQQMNPDRVRSAVKGESKARASPPTPQQEADALAGLRQEHPEVYAESLAALEGYGWWKGIENGFCSDQLRQLIRERLAERRSA